MATATQTNRPLEVTTPLGKDALLLTSFSGHEGLSQLYSFRLDCIAPLTKDVAFDKLLGQGITVRLELPNGKTRHFNGICSRVSQGESDSEFTDYHLEIVPRLWLLTKRARSRIFQHMGVPDILKKVLEGLDVSYELQGTFHARDFCVQYRETDFNFASRLMEEEGIYYFFKHSDGSHKMVVANDPQSHPAVATGKILYKNLTENTDNEDIIYDWSKSQEVTSGKYTLWDHSFELPHKHLEADKIIQDSVQVGQAAHKLKVSDNGKLEVYDWPGEYAQRFDGIDRGGAERPAELQKVFQDNARTTNIRMQQEAVTGLVIQGASNCRQMVSGYRFTLTTLAQDPLSAPFKANGDYVLTSVAHSLSYGGNYRSGDWSGLDYNNSFSAIPLALPFRPSRTTPKPVVPGSQTAVVVGPPGEEIFTDKYGRIKVQFHWDREGENNADSSCWMRVGTLWAGKQWGIIHIPRIGQEVIVDFLEGDPDQPIVVGSVFNAEQMPAYKLPDEKTKSYIKTNTSPGGEGFNEIRFEDKKDKEQIFIHAQRNMDVRVRQNSRERVIANRHLIVGWEKDGNKGGDQKEMVYQDKHLNVKRNQVEHIEGNVQQMIGKGDAKEGGNLDFVTEKDKKQTIMGNYLMHVLQALGAQIDGGITVIMNSNVTSLIKGNSHQKIDGEKREQLGGDQSLSVGGSQKGSIGGANHLKVGGDQNVQVGGSQSLSVGGDQHEKVGKNHAVEAGQEVHIKAGMKVIIEAGAQLSLKGPGGFVDIGPSGVTIVGTIVNINSGGSAGSGSGSSPKSPAAPALPDDASKNAPKDAAEAKPQVPEKADNATTGKKSAPG